MKIVKVSSRQIFDSRGNPTVEADVYLDDGSMGRASVPSGASTGSHEAHELRDGGKDFGGLGVEKAITNIKNVIAPAVVGKVAEQQSEIDKSLLALDGTPNKSKLGANAILAVSLAVAKASANYRNLPLYSYLQQLYGTKEIVLPMPMVNILNGGKHAEGSTTIQEFMIVPVAATTMPQAMQMSSEVFHSLGKVLKGEGYSTTVGDEGGYAPHLKGGNTEALDLIVKSISKAGYKPGTEISIALDVAASELFDGKTYTVEANRGLNASALVDWYQQLSDTYPIISIEDGLAEDEWPSWQSLMHSLGDKIQLVGDDLIVTNTNFLQKAVKMAACNAVIIKPNQVGTLTETVETILAAKKAGFRTIVSHRSGETEDTTIAHLAVGLATGQIKTGSFSRSERTAKYNELLRISELAPHAPLYRF